MHVLENYPRDELFQIDADTLLRFAQDILALYERPRVRALARVDQFDRFVSILVYVPKDRYDTSVRRRIGDFLANVYHGRASAAYPSYPEGPLARTHYIIGRDEGKTPMVDRATLEEASRRSPAPGQTAERASHRHARRRARPRSRRTLRRCLQRLVSRGLRRRVAAGRHQIIE